MRKRKRILLFLALTASALVINAGWATAADDVWLLLLKQQLLDTRKCFFEHIVHVRTFELADVAVIDGRVRCMDGREFYFTRPKPHLAYELRECEPAVC